MKARRAALAFAFGALLAAAAAHAWPQKRIIFVVPAPPGGTMDVMARAVGAQLSPRLGQPVIVEHRPGAGGALAVKAVLDALPDGHTLLFTGSSVLTEIPHVLAPKYDTLSDLRPVADLGRAHLVLIAHPAVPAGSLHELIAYARRNPGKLSYASYSPGTAAHYCGLILNRREGLDLQHVPYKGSPPALADVIAGQVPLMFDGIVTSLPHIRSGKVKVLAISSRGRSSLLPQVATFAELGYPEIDFSNWIGVAASAKMPAALAATINRELLALVAMPGVRERLLELGFEPAPASTPEQLAAMVRADFERNARIVKAFNITFE
ncbi:MAG TPA: tripartite tricarboxylate transporter substrate binding protein [Burkholderiales bacterium]|nr:tripartite tricarboxylate transporter substrate binding protein [Burkholderiales bacterium]